MIHSETLPFLLIDADMREAYIDEVFTAVGLPLFLEGPDDVVDQGKIHPNSVQGLPKFVNYEGGIFR